MTHRTLTARLLACCASLLLVSGCFGPFNLTRRLYRWNVDVGDSGEREIAFLVLTVIPIYAAAAIGDALVLNAMEYWTKENPVDPPPGPGASLEEQRIVRGPYTARLSRTDTPGRRTMTITLSEDGRTQQTLQFERHAGRRATVTDGAGLVLFTAETLPDGHVALTDADGQPVASLDAAGRAGGS